MYIALGDVMTSHSIRLTIYLSVYLFIKLFIHLSTIRPSIHVSVLMVLQQRVVSPGERAASTRLMKGSIRGERIAGILANISL